MDLLSFFFPKTLEETQSKINGKVTVRSYFGRCEIIVGGYQQSGRLVGEIWSKALRFAKFKYQITNNKSNSKFKLKLLVLGFGGGSIVKPIHKYFPNAQITGVELDEVIVNLGKKYLLNSEIRDQKSEIIVGDAFDKTSMFTQEKKKFDLILIDLYLGGKMVDKVTSEKFLKDIKKLLNPNGVALFNSLRDSKTVDSSNALYQALQKHFKIIKWVNPVANRVFLCKNSN